MRIKKKQKQEILAQNKKPQKKYIFLSDLHIGGEGVFEPCDFKEELIEFLLSLKDPKTEVILVGDTFGLWEIYSVSNWKKILVIIEQHKDIFNAFKIAGSKVKITLIPGNHDHELAAYPKIKSILKKYNLNLEPKLYITRKIGSKKIWIEHGHQQDKYNYISNMKDPNAKPIGYYFNHTIVQETVKTTAEKSPWLKNVLAINSPKEIPNWFFSSYFYKEMHPLLRYIVTPVLLFSSFAILLIGWYAILFAGRFIERFLIGTTFLSSGISQQFGLASQIWNLGLLISGLSLGIVIVFFLPLALILYDVRRAFSKFGLQNKDDKNLVYLGPYESHAKQIFQKHKDVVLFVYGHTHRASIKQIGQKVILNTGTWLKILRKRKTLAKLLPAIYEPSFKLNYFIVQKEGKDISITTEIISKKKPKGKKDSEASILEKILPKKKIESIILPKKILIQS